MTNVNKPTDRNKAIKIFIISFAIIISLIYFINSSYIAVAVPSISKDPKLKVETVVNGLSSPTGMAFIDNNNILVLEKDGLIRLVSHGILQDRPILKVSVSTESERGLLGIAILNASIIRNEDIINSNNTMHVFLYMTELQGSNIHNKVYRYDWNQQTNSLWNPLLILDLPALPGPNHDGGKIAIGPDKNLYVIIGDLNHRGKLQNIKEGKDSDDTSVIFRVNPNDGSPAKGNPFINDTNTLMQKYYAYGIRNSFGITFDPLTGILWQTENGPEKYDEINLIKPGFNGGWIKITGPLSRNPNIDISQLVNYPGSHYADPIFSWKDPVAVTGIEFMKSSSIGEKYKDNIFVGDYNNGNLYYFEVNDTRTGVKNPMDQENTPSSGFIVDNENQLQKITFGNGFGSISDIKIGPKDGFLYILSINDGKIYRIVPILS